MRDFCTTQRSSRKLLNNKILSWKPIGRRKTRKSLRSSRKTYCLKKKWRAWSGGRTVRAWRQLMKNSRQRWLRYVRLCLVTRTWPKFLQIKPRTSNLCTRERKTNTIIFLQRCVRCKLKTPARNDLDNFTPLSCSQDGKRPRPTRSTTKLLVRTKTSDSNCSRATSRFLKYKPKISKSCKTTRLKLINLESRPQMPTKSISSTWLNQVMTTSTSLLNSWVSATQSWKRKFSKYTRTLKKNEAL